MPIIDITSPDPGGLVAIIVVSGTVTVVAFGFVAFLCWPTAATREVDVLYVMLSCFSGSLLTS